MAKEITLTSPDGTKFKVLTRHIRLIEPRNPEDITQTHKSIGLSPTRIFVATGQVWVVKETPEEIQALIDS